MKPCCWCCLLSLSHFKVKSQAKVVGVQVSTMLHGDFSTSPPQVLQKFDPEYTHEALDAKLQGTVTLSVVITPEGRASQISVVKSLSLDSIKRPLSV
jgi:outer membrane biosynthesis protein TonB